jgi:hypothetical protein
MSATPSEEKYNETVEEMDRLRDLEFKLRRLKELAWIAIPGTVAVSVDDYALFSANYGHRSADFARFQKMRVDSREAGS